MRWLDLGTDSNVVTLRALERMPIGEQPFDRVHRQVDRLVPLFARRLLAQKVQELSDGIPNVQFGVTLRDLHVLGDTRLRRAVDEIAVNAGVACDPEVHSFGDPHFGLDASPGDDEERLESQFLTILQHCSYQLDHFDMVGV